MAIDDDTILKVGVTKKTKQRLQQLHIEQKIKSFLKIFPCEYYIKVERLSHFILKRYNVERFVTKNHVEWLNVKYSFVTTIVNIIIKIVNKYLEFDTIYKKMMKLISVIDFDNQKIMIDKSKRKHEKICKNVFMYILEKGSSCLKCKSIGNVRSKTIYDVIKKNYHYQYTIKSFYSDLIKKYGFGKKLRKIAIQHINKIKN